MKNFFQNIVNSINIKYNAFLFYKSMNSNFRKRNEKYIKNISTSISKLGFSLRKSIRDMKSREKKSLEYRIKNDLYNTFKRENELIIQENATLVSEIERIRNKFVKLQKKN